MKSKKPLPLLKMTAGILAALSICFCISACKEQKGDPPPDIDIAPPDDQKDNNDKDNPVYTYEYKTDVSAFLEAITTENLFLVNKKNPCGEGYAPASLVKLPEAITYKDIELDSAAATALSAMIAEMNAYGISDVFVTSAYRDYAYQSYLYNYYFGIEKQNAPHLSDEEIKQKVLSYSAYPGTSEHQSGLCVDFMTSKMTELVNYGTETSADDDLGFAETEAFEWLKENAHKFGFILRYPKDKVSVTEYSYESWHYRFVGRAAASKIHFESITLEEYLNK